MSQLVVLEENKPQIIWLYAYEFHPQTTQTPADLWRNLFPPIDGWDTVR